MNKINFVPDDYIQQRESNRANLMYMGLLIAVLVGMALTFSVIKVRQRAVESELSAVDERLEKAHAQILLLDKLQAKSKAMMKTALITVELADPVSKSVVLASLTNNLPAGTSLDNLRISDKEVKITLPQSGQTQYESKSKSKKKSPAKTKTLIETQIEISGFAPSDIEVANYIAQLGESFLFENVGLIESSEQKDGKYTVRKFKLKATIKRDVKLSAEDVAKIRDMKEMI